MATLKLILDTSRKKKDPEATYPLVIKVSHRTKRKHLQTGYNLRIKDWDEKTQRVKKNYVRCVQANIELGRQYTKALEILSGISELDLKRISVYDLATVLNQALDAEKQDNIGSVLIGKLYGTKLKEYSDQVVSRYRTAHRSGTADSYAGAVQALLRYHGKDDILIVDITEDFLEGWEAQWLGAGKKLNGLGVYLRSIRRIYNLAIKDRNTEVKREHYPFGLDGYSIKKSKTKKRAIDPEYFDKIKELNYTEGSALWHHRNYFLLMYYFRGMNFIDLAYLRMDNLEKGRIKYERRKTKRGQNVKAFNIKVPDEVLPVLTYYTQGKSQKDRIFPILDGHDELNPTELWEVYKEKYRNHNKRLNTIAKHIDFEGRLTTYVARHTFATTGKYRGIPKAQIGEMLGHTSSVTTEAYFAEFDTEVLDEAADHILS